MLKYGPLMKFKNTEPSLNPLKSNIVAFLFQDMLEIRSLCCVFVGFITTFTIKGKYLRKL